MAKSKSSDLTIPVLLLGGVAVVIAYTQRCTWFKMCGDGDVPAEAAAEEIPTAEPAPPTLPVIEGRLSEAKADCCKCKRKKNGDIRCQRHGKGNWMRYRSAKKDILGALNICRNGCVEQPTPQKRTTTPVQLNSYYGEPSYYGRIAI